MSEIATVASYTVISSYSFSLHFKQVVISVPWVKEDVFDWGGGGGGAQQAAVRRVCVLGE